MDIHEPIPATEKSNQNPVEKSEYDALTGILTAYHSYGYFTRKDLLSTKTKKYQTLSENEKELLPWFSQYLIDLDSCITINEKFTQLLSANVAQSWGVPDDSSVWSSCNMTDLDKVRSILLQLTREWSVEGAKEREDSFGRILKEVENYYPDIEKRQNLKVLVPGAGLGRLVLEFVKRGFWCQGNEHSYHMLLASNFILNHAISENSFSIHPFIHKSSNVIDRQTQLRSINIPDYNPKQIPMLQQEHPSIPFEDLMSMSAGSFTDLYGPGDLALSDFYTADSETIEFRKQNENHYDVLATCFFLDTAVNVIDYLKTIYHCLSPNGIWVNFGPLLWHYEDDKKELNLNYKTSDGVRSVISPMGGLELSKQDLYDLIEKIGFKFEKYESNIETTYAGDSKSLAGWNYKCEYWVCKKAHNPS